MGDQMDTSEHTNEAEASVKSDIQQPQQSSLAIGTRDPGDKQPQTVPKANTNSIATPAIRHLLKKHNLSISDIVGTGKGGRVLKEDVELFISEFRSQPSPKISVTGSEPRSPGLGTTSTGEDRLKQLSPVENQMFKVMTSSLSIPHFQYTHSVDLTAFMNSRTRLLGINANSSGRTIDQSCNQKSKLTPLAFILKALSQVFTHFLELNSHLDISADSNNPTLTLKASHDFGIAVDTPRGLLVPVIRQVQSYSVLTLAAEIKRISMLAREGQLKPEDFQNATFSISNIGSIGACGAVHPIIVAPMVGILGIGGILDVPAFSTDRTTGLEQIIKAKKAVLSWSADHRVIDGATIARAAEMLATLLNDPDILGLTLR